MSDKIVSYEIDQNNMICYIFFFLRVLVCNTSSVEVNWGIGALQNAGLVSY